MPNRILREGILDSDPIGQVSIGAECLFMRLLVLVDDFGRFDGRVSVICRRAFVNRRSVDEHMTAEWLSELGEARLVRMYEVGGKPYLQVENFRQRTRAHGSKYPPPPGDECKQDQSLISKNDGHSSDTRMTDDGPPRTYSYSKSKTRNTPLPPDEGEQGGDAPGDGALASADGSKVAARPRAVQAVGIKAWLQQCAERGEKPIPEGSAPLQYAQQAGIPPEFVQLHWREFKTRHSESGKRYVDWRKVMLNSLRGNWYGLWLLHPDGSCVLSTKGLQAKRVAEVMAGGE